MTTQFPPSGFRQVESAVDGIVVFAPAPKTEEHQEVVDFKCPNCGADRAYSAADGGLRCPACGYHEIAQVEVVGKDAQEFEFTVDTLQSSAHGWGIERMEIACENCGAVTTHPPEMLTHTCPFCNSSKLIQRKAPQDILRPRFLVPLKIEEPACHQNTKKWLGSSWMTPKDLSSESVINNFSPMYIPYWTFDAITAATWKAQVGHTRTTGSGKNRRTHTVWKWESGNVRLDIDDLLVSGTSRVSEVLLNRSANFNTEGLVPYEPSFLAGILSQAYERTLETAWDMGRDKMRDQTKQSCMNQASSKKIRNFSMNMDFENEKWRYILLPIYVSAYHYDGQLFQVLVNGQTGAVAGQRPVDWKKVWAWVIAALIPGAIAMLIGLIAYLLDPSEDPAGLLGLLRLVGYGGLFIFAVAFAWAGKTINTAMSYDDI